MNQRLARTLSAPSIRLVAALVAIAALGLWLAHDAQASGSGDGALTVSPASVTAGSTGNVLTFRFSPTNGAFSSGSALSLTIPAGWTPPQSTSGTSPGFVSVAVGGCTSASLAGISGSTITVNFACKQNKSLTITYGGGGTKVTAPTVAGATTFTTASKASGGAFVNLITGSPAVTVNPGAAAQMAFTASPGNSSAGTPFVTQPAATLRDVYGNIATNDNSSQISLAIVPGTGTAGATLACAANPRTVQAGVATFSGCNINRPGTGYQLKATKAGSSLSATSAAFNIALGPPAKLLLTKNPTSSAAGVAFATQPQVAITDAGGNTVTASSATVSLAIGTNPAGGTLSGTISTSASGGLASFAGLSIDRSGTGYTLSATSPGLTPATSAAFNISPGAPSKLAFSVQPSAAAPSTAIAPALKVQIQDAFGNLTASTASVTVALASNPTGAALGGTTTVAAVAGTATFGNLTVNKIGTYTLGASSAGVSGAVSASFSVTQPSKLAFGVQPASAAMGATISPAVTVQVQDANGVLMSSSTATVAIAIGSNTGGATLHGTLSVPAVNGVATFANLSLDKFGTGYTFVATSAGLSSATSNAVRIDPVIAAAGDIACDPSNPNYNAGKGTTNSCHEQATSNLLLSSALAAVLPLGDNQYYCGGYNAFTASFDPSWGRVRSITHPVVGNHEYLTHGGTDGGTGCDATNANAAGYYQYFGSAAGDPTKGYYSYDIGTWHLIALNTQCSAVGGCGNGSPQLTWLQADLAAHQNYCTLAYFHIPLFSSGGRASPNAKPLWDALYAANADLVLTAHDHLYERFGPQTSAGVLDNARGLREFVIGTGGANHTSFTSNIFPNSEVRNDTTFGVLKLVLRPDGYDWQFVPEPGQSFTDTGSTACHGGTPPDTQPPTTPSNLTGTVFGPSKVSLSWTGSTDDIGVAGYNIFRDGTQIATSPSNAYTDATAPPGASHTYWVTAYDDSDNASGRSNSVSLTTPADTQPPSAPTLTATAAGPDKIRLDWTASTDDGYVASYVVYRGGVQIVSVSTLTYTDTGLQASTSYSYSVVAVDGTGKRSNASNTATATTLAPPVTLTFTPDADTYVNAGSPTTNYGSSRSLRLDSSPEIRSYIRFNVQGTGVVQQATLRVFANSSQVGGMDAHNVADDNWAERTVNFNTAPPLDAAVAGSSDDTITAGTWEEIDVTSLVNGDGLLTIGLTSSSTTALSLASRESGANAPQLVVVTSPLPPTPTPTQGTPTNTATATPTLAPQTDTTFVPSADAYVNAGSPAVNFGSSTSLRVDGSPALTSYLTFDVEGVGTPTRAILRIFPNASAGTGFDVHRVQDTTWGESTITFDTAPAVDQAIIGSSGALTLGVPVDVDVTSLIAGNGVVSLALTSAGSTQLSLASREWGANAPQLIVSASIVPPTATATATDTATATETATASATPTETATLTETPAPTVTPTPTATLPPQTDTTFVPAADAYVSAGSPAVNFGSSTSLRVQASPALNSYLTFDIEGVGTPSHVILRIYPNSSAGTGFDVHRVQDARWGESTVTFSNAPAIDAAIIGSAGALTAGVPVDIDVTSAVTGNGLVSFALTKTTATQLNLASRESGANAPQLIVSASIVPPTATATATDTATPTLTATDTATPVATATATSIDTATASDTPTATEIATDTDTPTPTDTPVPAP